MDPYDNIQMEQLSIFLPSSVGHLVGAVVHAHQRLLVINAGKHDDDGGVGDDQVQVALGEVKVDGLKATVNNQR